MTTLFISLVLGIAGASAITNGVMLHLLGFKAENRFSGCRMGKWIVVLGVILLAAGAWIAPTHVG